MNSDLHEPAIDPLTSKRLSAFDDALASGASPPDLPPSSEEDEALLRLLHQLRPRPVPQRAETTASAAAESRYVLKELFAVGGVGQVWLAQDADLGREVALKVLHPERALDPLQEARFLHEARITGRLQHPGIVPVYELVATPEGDQSPFYTMRLIPGRTLAESVSSYHKGRSGGVAERLGRVRLLNAFVAVCQTVAFAHSKGVIHRDLKPQNVALGDFGEVIVLDWGFAKAEATAEVHTSVADQQGKEVPAWYTLSGQVVGTPSYMAPEQAAGQKEAVAVSADVYGLGAILYEILTGQPPYSGDNGSQVLKAVRSGPPQRPSALATVPPALEAICMRAMARDPAARYPSAAALAGEVQHWLADEPVEAYREPLRARTRRWIRRHPALAAGCFVLLATALLGVGISRELIGREQARSALEHVQIAWTQAETKARSEAELTQQLYFHRIALAERMLAALNPTRATQLLAECPSSLRGWEWDCLDRMCRTDAVVWRGHANTVVAVAISPDGQSLASAGFDHGARVWDMASGRVRLTYSEHKGVVYHLAYSPDGRRIASAGWDGTVRIWEADSGHTIQILEGLGKRVNRVAFTPDGRRLLTLDQDTVVRLWDLADGRTLWTLDGDRDPSWHLMALAVRPDGRLAAAAGGGLFIELIDLETGRVVGRLEGHKHLVRALAFSRDGSYLASGDGDVGRSDPGEVRVWDMAQRATVKLFRGHTEPIFALDFNADGSRLASASQDHTVKVWDLKTCQEALTLHGHTDAVRCATFSTDGRLLATAGADRTIRIWDATPGAAAPSPRLLQNLTDPNGAVFDVAFDPTGQRLASVGDGRVVRFYEDGKPAGASPQLGGPRVDYLSLRYSPDGRHVATASSAGVVTILDAADGHVERELEGHAAGPIKKVAYSPDGTMLASASWDRTIQVWDPATGKRLHVLEGHREAVTGLEFSPDNRLLASSGYGRTVRIWDASTGEKLRTLSHPTVAVFTVAFSPTEPLLATAGTDGVIRLWDTGTWKIRQELRGHAGAVWALAFSPDGRLLASAGQDWRVKLWRPDQSEVLFTLRGHTERVQGLAFHPSGQRLATAGNDGTVKVWDVSFSGN